MKIAVLSDIHSNLVNLSKVRTAIEEEKVAAVFCCGDIQTEDVLIEFKRWKMPIYLCWGNADIALREKTENNELDHGHVKISDEYGEAEIRKRKIAFTHTDELARKLAGMKKYDLVFYGHTHTPWISVQEETTLVNPGEVAGHFGPATFALCELDGKMKPELKVII